MALRIIYGKAGSGKSQYIYEEINQHINCAKKTRSQMHDNNPRAVLIYCRAEVDGK